MQKNYDDAEYVKKQIQTDIEFISKQTEGYDCSKELGKLLGELLDSGTSLSPVKLYELGLSRLEKISWEIERELLIQLSFVGMPKVPCIIYALAMDGHTKDLKELREYAKELTS